MIEKNWINHKANNFFFKKIILNNEFRKKKTNKQKRIFTLDYFLDLWPRSLDLTNEMLIEEIGKIINYINGLKIKKIAIKIIEVKINIKNKLEVTIKFFIEGLNWEEKIILTKEKKNLREWGPNWKK